MDAPYHREILQKALGERVSPRALEAITAANLNQDSLAGLLRPEFHFDDSQFDQSLAYVEECRAAAGRAVDPAEAWAAFGRLTHSVQDFYAHSNYVQLWADLQTLIPGDRDTDRARLPPTSKMKALDAYLLKHPKLKSARVYLPLEALCLVAPLRPLVRLFLPRDSHAWMNLDNPRAGALFPYALEAATQRTVFEFERTLTAIKEAQGAEALRRFLDQ